MTANHEIDSVELTPAWAEHVSRKLGIVAIGAVATAAMSFVVSVMVARLLGPGDLARYATVTVACLLVGQLSDLGLANAFGYYARHRPKTVRHLLRILARHVLLCGGVLALIYLIATEIDNSIRVAISPGWFAVVLAAFVLMGMSAAVLPVLVLARGRYTAYVLFTGMVPVLQLVMILIVAASGDVSWRRFVTASAIAQGVIVCVEIAYLWRLATCDSHESISSRECYRYGLRIKWAEIMKLLTGRVDLLIVASVMSASQVGLYSVATAFRELGMMPLRVYSGILQNLLVDREREGQSDRQLVLGSVIIQAGVSTALIIAALFMVPIVVPLLYGERYAGLSGPAIVLFASTPFLSIAGLCWMVFNMRGRPGLTSQIVTVSGLIGPILVWSFARAFDLYGAAWAGVISAMITCSISLAALVRVRGYSSGDALAAARLTPTLLRHLRLGAFATIRRAGMAASGPR
jgi:O-antigen/teichoic acid export membrane protein